MVTKPTGRRSGRPHLPLRDDPERHAFAYFVGRLTASSPLYLDSPHALAKLIMQAHYGIIDTPETRDAVTDALLDGRDFRLSMRTIKGRNNAESKEQWRDRDSANAMADNFCKKARNLEADLLSRVTGSTQPTTKKMRIGWR